LNVVERAPERPPRRAGWGPTEEERVYRTSAVDSMTGNGRTT
jgi:hypothetical protein